MLSKNESIRTTRVREKIRGKWNLKEKAINTSEEKMLATIRNIKDNKTNGSNSNASRKSVPNKNSNFSETTEKPHSVESTAQCEACISVNVEGIMSNNTILDSGIDDDSFEIENIQDAFDVPGARKPQPYSSTNVSNVSFPMRMPPTDKLRPHSTQGKPLCESDKVNSSRRQSESNLNLEVLRKPSSTAIVAKLEDEDMPERDVNSNLMEAIPLGPPLRVFNKKIVDTQKSAVEVNNSGNIVVTPSDEDEATIIAKPCTVPLNVPNRNVQIENNANPIKVNMSRTPSSSRNRPLLSSRRPPSRKPHMLSSDDDTDQDFLPVQPSTANINLVPEVYDNHKIIDPYKQHPPSRMYSTLKDTPHSVQESIKSVIRDLDGIKVASGVRKESQTDYVQNTIRNENNSPSSHPSSRIFSVHTPRMSQGTVRILQDKANFVSPATPVLNNKSRDCVLVVREASPNAWIRNTRRQDFKEEKRNPLGGQKSIISGNKCSTTSNIKPSFKHCSSSNKIKSDCSSQKLKQSSINRKKSIYLPPWKRVNLTPPESALKERALHEKKSGNVESSTWDRSTRPSTPVVNRTVRKRTPENRTLSVNKSPGENWKPNPAEPRTPFDVPTSELDKPRGSSRPTSKPLLQVSFLVLTLINLITIF